MVASCFRKHVTSPTTMKRNKLTLGLTALLLAGALQSNAQNLVQTLRISLITYNSETGKALSINTRDVIRYFTGENVPGARLELVTPAANQPGGVGNLNAYLRVVQKSGEVLTEVTSPDQFNLFQDTAVATAKGSAVLSRAINRFSIDFAQLHAELQGFSNWKIRTSPVRGEDLSGAGSFTSAVNGIVTVDGVTQYSPARGTVTASAPHLE